MTSNLPSDCPFVAGAMLTQTRYFIGRREALDFITRRMTATQPTSVNIHGDRRIGKSSLLNYFALTYEQRLDHYGKQKEQYVVVYLSLEGAPCQQETSFYQAIAHQLLARGVVRSNAALASTLQDVTLDRLTFTNVLTQWKKQGVLPVLCLDDFECLFKHPEGFDNGFYENLRALINQSLLMLIIATPKQFDYYRKQHGFTSNFFNVLSFHPLGEFTTEEATSLVQLPDPSQSALSEERRRLALAWGESIPIRLQIAGICLWEAQRDNRPDEVAKANFERQVKGLPSRSWVKDIPSFLRKLSEMPMQLMNLVESLGNYINKIVVIGMGTILLIYIILAFTGNLPASAVFDQGKKFVCSTLSSALGKFCE